MAKSKLKFSGAFVYAQATLATNKRSPSWRMERVRDLFDSGKRRAAHRDDKQTKRFLNYMWKYLPVIEGGDDPIDASMLHQKYPDIAVAHSLYLEDSSVCGSRWYVEAALISGLEPNVIAEIIDVSTKAVETFHDLFFDVRHRLDKAMWVFSKVLHLDIERSSTSSGKDFLWKFLGYFGGWDILLAFWDRGKMTDERREWFAETLKDGILKKAWEASQVALVNRFTVNELLQTALKLLEVENEAEALDANEDAFAEVRRMLEETGHHLRLMDLEKKLPARESVTVIEYKVQENQDAGETARANVAGRTKDHLLLEAGD